MRIVLTAILVVPLVALLIAIIRFSLISPRRVRGAEARLRHPEPRGIQALVGFEPPALLVEFFKNSRLVEETEFYLADNAVDPPKSWFIGGFTPLTRTDVAEQLKISGLSRVIPIATDSGKGIYFVSSQGSVELALASGPKSRELVARSIDELELLAFRRGD